MKRFSILAITLCAICGSAFGQQALFGGQMPLSPEIHADKTVTFRCMAPGAQKVQITGDFLPTKKIDTPMGKYDMPGVADLKKD
ncbi:MAG: esterase, partial [Segatella copri]